MMIRLSLPFLSSFTSPQKRMGRVPSRSLKSTPRSFRAPPPVKKDSTVKR